MPRRRHFSPDFLIEGERQTGSRTYNRYNRYILTASIVKTSHIMADFASSVLKSALCIPRRSAIFLPRDLERFLFLLIGRCFGFYFPLRVVLKRDGQPRGQIFG